MALRKIKTGSNFNIPAVRLYIEDLTSFINQIKEKGFNIINWRADEYFIDEIEDIKTLGTKKVSIMHLQGYKTNKENPELTIYLNKPSANKITINDNTDELVGFAHNLQTILKSKKNYSYYLIRYMLLPFILALFVIFGFVANVSWGTITAISALYFLVVIMLLGEGIPYNKLLIETRNSQTFLQRNKDKILLIIITALFTFLATILGQLLLSK